MAAPPTADGVAENPDLASPSSPSAAPPEAQEPSTQRPHTTPPLPSLSTTAGMTASSTPLGPLNAARRPGPPQATASRSNNLPQDLQAKLKAFQIGRQGAPPPSAASLRSAGSTPSGGIPPGPFGPASPRIGPGGVPANFRMPPSANRPPGPMSLGSTPSVPNLGKKQSLAEKRGLTLAGGLSGSQAPPPAAGGRKKPAGLTLSQMNASDNAGANGNGDSASAKPDTGSLLDKYANFIDAKTGSLKFDGKAVLTNQGVEFSSGSSFSISLDEVDTLDELGKGNYGTVYKVRHSRPRIRRPGMGLAGNKANPQMPSLSTSSSNASDQSTGEPVTPAATGGTSGVVMAMKEIRLELDDAKFAAIIMELDILHRCISPFIVDFYGAFFQEGAVYICMEFMDGGSIDKIYADGVPEGVLRKIALSTTMGLKSLKDDHNIIHRDVKPTNILVNTRGQVKICDFGVSGNLVASIAKTNIGCQSYMAPERISSGGVASAGANPGGGTYSVQSDIWSLGLTIIECALGRYPYPPETYDNIFSQLSAIVDGVPPDLPADKFSVAARDFVSGCLMKIPKLRPTYAMLLQHAWLAPLLKPPTISEEDEEEGEAAAEKGALVTHDSSLTADKEVAAWAIAAIERRRSGAMKGKAKPALHTAPLDAVTSPSLEMMDKPAVEIALPIEVKPA